MLICIAGAVAGLIIAVFANVVLLPMVLRAQERHPTIRLPFPGLLGDARRLTIAIYRYVMPLTFAIVGAVAAYHLFIADAP
jgi:hypothetical protein